MPIQSPYKMVRPYPALIILIIIGVGLSTTCHDPNCNSCTTADQFNCQGCASGYSLKNGTCCSNTLSACTSCSTNSTVCNGCTNNTFYLDGTNQCLTCQSTLSGCLTCNSSTQCISCTNNSFIFNASASQCQSCSSLIPNCSICNSSATCTACINSNFLLRLGSCIPCELLLTNCLTCSSQTVCTVCQNGDFVIRSGRCVGCSFAMTGCLTCNSSTICTSCASNMFILQTNQCIACSTILHNCLTCNSTNFCLDCLDSSFVPYSGTCVFCSSLMTNCLRCSSPTACVVCASTFGVNTNTSLCEPCSSFISNCLSCISSTACTICIDDTFYVNSTAQCATCLSNIPNCLTCASSSVCKSCINDSLAVDPSSNRCQVCSTFMSHCTNCLSSSVCTACAVSPNVILNSSKCVACSAVMANCLNCTRVNYCTVCNKYSLLVLSTPLISSCPLCANLMAGCIECSSQTVCSKCIYGQIVTGGCSSVFGCTAVVKRPPKSVCVSCESSIFQVNPINGVCACKVGHLAGRYCTQIKGCSMITRTSAGDQCIRCSQVNNFYFKDGLCYCLEYYQLKGEVCSDICGDGIRLALPCDDGNLIDGDGCSSTCQVETRYTCLSLTFNSSSICVYKGEVSIEALCVYRLQENTARIELALSPYVANIHKSNVALSFAVPNKNCSMTSYALAGSNVFVFLSYHEDIEGSYANVSLRFDSNYIVSSDATATVPMRDCSGEGLLYEPIAKSSKETITAMASVLSFAVVLSWLCGSYAHRMIGVETLHTFQFIVVTQSFALRYSVFKYFARLSSALNLFQGSAAPLSSLSHSQLSRLGYSADFLYNCGVVALAELFAFVLFVALKCCKANDKTIAFANTDANQGSECKGTMAKLKERVYDFLVFPLFIGFFVNLVVSLAVHLTRSSKGSLNSLLQTAAILFIAVVTYALFFRQCEQMRRGKNVGLRENYMSIYLINLLVLSFASAAALFGLLPYPLYALAGLTALYTLFILLYRPYHNMIHNIGIVINQLGVSLNLAWLISQGFILLPKTQEEMIALAVAFWMIIIVAFAIIRTIFQLAKPRQDSADIKLPNATKKRASKIQIHQIQVSKLISIKQNQNFNPYSIESQIIREKQLQRSRQLWKTKAIKDMKKQSLRKPLKQ